VLAQEPMVDLEYDKVPAVVANGESSFSSLVMVVLP